jgi:lysophospholipase L1-like esterase
MYPSIENVGIEKVADYSAQKDRPFFDIEYLMKLLKPIVNQRMRLIAATLMVGTIVLDVGVLEMRYLVPDTIRPSDSNFVANPSANGAVLMNLAQQSGKPCDVIFIGASNVEYWNTEGKAVWDHYYAPRHAFNFGVAGDKTQNVLWRFDHMNLYGLKPKVAVIFVGLNNVNSTPREVVMGIKAITKKTQATFPGVKVFVVSLTPNDRDNAQVVKANKLLRAYADNQNIFFVNIYSRMPREGDNWKGLRPDHIHLTAAGYQMWADQMEPLMQKFLSPLPTDATASAKPLPVTTN